MTIETEIIDGRKVCTLSGTLSIWEAAEAWKQLSKLLQSKSTPPLVFDISKVESCDCAGLQILCQIQRAVEKDHARFHDAGISESVSAVLTQAGVDKRSFPHCFEKE